MIILNKDYLWELVIAIEDRRSQIEHLSPSVTRYIVGEEAYEEYVFLTQILGPLYDYLTEGAVK